MALVNLTQAAKLAGVSRATIYRAINRGDLSKIKGDDEQPAIDTAELRRVYPSTDRSTPTATLEDTTSTAALHKEIFHLRELLDAERRNNDDLRYALRQIAHIPPQQQPDQQSNPFPAPTAQTTPQTPKRGFFGRLFGRKPTTTE